MFVRSGCREKHWFQNFFAGRGEEPGLPIFNELTTCMLELKGLINPIYRFWTMRAFAFGFCNLIWMIEVGKCARSALRKKSDWNGSKQIWNGPKQSLNLKNFRSQPCTDKTEKSQKFSLKHKIPTDTHPPIGGGIGLPVICARCCKDGWKQRISLL